MGRIGKNLTRIALILCVLAAMTTAWVPTVFAVQATATYSSNSAGAATASFGSKSYEWYPWETNPIGINVELDQGTIASVDITVTYDSDMLSYEYGGDSYSSNTVRIQEEDIGSNEYSRWLYFTPTTSGTAEVQISSAKITDTNGKTYTANSQTTSVTITMLDSCALSGITINGKEVSGFSSDQTEYTMDVANDVTKATVQTTPSSLEVAVSGSNLTVGENSVTILTTDYYGNQARYVVNVRRAAAGAASSAVASSSSAATASAGTSSTAAAGSVSNNGGGISQILIWGIIIGLALLLLLFLFLLVRAFVIHGKRKKHAAERHAAEHNGPREHHPTHSNQQNGPKSGNRPSGTRYQRGSKNGRP